jgi:hypothetical protein
MNFLRTFLNNSIAKDGKRTLYSAKAETCRQQRLSDSFERVWMSMKTNLYRRDSKNDGRYSHHSGGQYKGFSERNAKGGPKEKRPVFHFSGDGKIHGRDV